MTTAHRSRLVPVVAVLPLVPQDTSLAMMLVKGELDVAPIGRALRDESNLIDRSTQLKPKESDWAKVRPLFTDRRAEILRFYEKYQCVPATQMYVIRGDVYREQPWVAFNMYEAFLKAKRVAHATLEDRIPSLMVMGREYLRDAQKTFGQDPYPYGVARNRDMLQTVIGFAAEQGVAGERAIHRRSVRRADSGRLIRRWRLCFLLRSCETVR